MVLFKLKVMKTKKKHTSAHFSIVEQQLNKFISNNTKKKQKTNQDAAFQWARGALPLKCSAWQPLVDHIVNITCCLSVGMFSYKTTSVSSHPHHSQCDGLWQTHFFVSLPLCLLTKWKKTGWHLVFSCVLSNVHFLPSWPATTLQTNWLWWLTLSFVCSVPACGPCHCGLAHGL